LEPDGLSRATNGRPLAVEPPAAGECLGRRSPHSDPVSSTEILAVGRSMRPAICDPGPSNATPVVVRRSNPPICQ